MKNQTELEKKTERKSRQRLKKKRVKMLVSGKSVLGLRRIIKNKGSPG